MNSDMETLVKSSVVICLQELMEHERNQHLKRKAYDRREDGDGDYRNGYYDRSFTMSIGKIQLRIPRTREGDFSPSIFEKYARYDQAFVLSMMEMVINGVSTRKVTKIVEQLCGESISKSAISRMTEGLDEVVQEWANRPLAPQKYRYLFADAMYIKVREENRVVSKAIYIAVGVTQSYNREILGLHVGREESFDNWTNFFQHLKQRGLNTPKIVISDAHVGLKKAIHQEFLGASWQRCLFHFKRNVFQKLPKKNTGDFRYEFKQIYSHIDPDESRAALQSFIEKYQEETRFHQALTVLEAGFEETIQYKTESTYVWEYIRTTNIVERLNREIRRREKVIQIFPNTASAFRLMGAVLMDLNEEYQKKNNRYMHGMKADIPKGKDLNK